MEVFEYFEKIEIEYSFDFESLDFVLKRFCKVFCLCICYVLNCGGIGILIGMGFNLVMKGLVDL